MHVKSSSALALLAWHSAVIRRHINYRGRLLAVAAAEFLHDEQAEFWCQEAATWCRQ